MRTVAYMILSIRARVNEYLRWRQMRVDERILYS